VGGLLVRAALAALAALACGDGREATAPGPAPDDARFAGSAACARCHPGATSRWRGSHHDRAMERAVPDAVRGDFGGASLVRDGERFEFRRTGDGFGVRVTAPDGAARDLPVLWTFGVEPLQQYLVPGPRGRLQVLPVAWDGRPAAEGGGRWIPLGPGGAAGTGDPLPWTGLAGSWNALCADCHATNLVKGHRFEADRYETTWSEPDVACEACHGPGAAHVAWAEAGGGGAGADPRLAVDLSRDVAWRFAPSDAIAHRVPARGSGPRRDVQLDVCAPCHARRTTVSARPEVGAPFLDGHHPALLEEGLYHADGSVQDEVYVWGSFLQSRMHAAGVTCSDCHDPHALRIDEPDAVCAGCHRPEAFARPAHHRHAPGSPGARCVACHMPAQTFMAVDVRRDHAFRVPRPGLADAVGAPHACGACHADRPTGWAAQAVAAWRGEAPAREPFGAVVHAGRRGRPEAAPALAALAADPERPAIVRATALALLGDRRDAQAGPAVVRGLADPDPLVRLAAVGAAEGLGPGARVRAVRPLLADPRRAVRVEAARVLAPLARTWEGPRDDLESALAEYRAAQEIHADRPEAHANLARLHEALGEAEAARRAWQRAAGRWPFFVPARLGLADWHRRRSDDAAAERVLREGIRAAPDAAALHHAHGLALVRLGRREAARAALERAFRLAPEEPRHAYVLGVALHAAGGPRRALDVLEAAWRRHPEDAELLFALATIARDAGDTAEARRFADRLAALRPDDPRARALLDSLRR